MKRYTAFFASIFLLLACTACNETPPGETLPPKKPTQSPAPTERVDWNTKETDSPFQYGSHVGTGGTEVIYRVRWGSEDGQPLVIWQHGSGGMGEDNEKHLTANDNAPDKLADRGEDFTVLIAQYPQRYSVPYAEGENEAMDNWLEAYAELIQSLTDTGKVDAGRVYLMGASMGGGIVLEFATQYPELFTCVVPVCATGTILEDLSVLDNVLETPMWLFHCVDDTTVDVANSDMVYEYLTAHNAVDVRYTRITTDELEQAGYMRAETHGGAWKMAFADEELFAWLFSQ